MELVELEEKEFVKFSKTYPDLLFFQSPYWIKVKEINGWKGKIFGLKDKNKLVAATIILGKKLPGINKYMYFAPRGFLLDYDNLDLLKIFSIKLRNELKKHNGLFLKINPYVKYQERDLNGDIIGKPNDKLIKTLKELGYKHQGFYIDQDKKKDIEPRWLSVLNLENKTEDELYQDMRQMTKRWIKNSEKNCLKIVEGKKEDLVEFKKLMQHTAARREFIDRPLEYYENLYDVLTPNNLMKVLLVEINFKELLNNQQKEHKELLDKIEKAKNNPHKEKEVEDLTKQANVLEQKINDLKDYIKEYGNTKIIAGGLYMLYGNHLVYLLGASYKDFMKYHSQYLLQWEMIKYAKKNGYKAFNFYGIDGNFDKDSKGFGLFDFKRGFNADVVELIGEFDLVIQPFWYKTYNFAFRLYHKLKNLRAK